MKWATATIDAIKAPSARALAGGPFGSNLTTRDYVDEGVPVIRGVNLPSDKKFLDDDFVFVSEEKAVELAPNVALPGDLIFTQRGTLGQVGLIPQNTTFPRYVISQSQMKLTVDPTKADALFIYYYFRHPKTVEAVQRRAITSGVPHINLGILRDFELPLPPVSTQSAIGEFLASYDDLIENNSRRMALLEQSARLLYEEWFVRLRFPGREHIRITNGVPEGWKRQRLEDVAEFRLGKMLDQKKNKGDPMPYLANVNVRWGSFDLCDLREMRFEDDEFEAFGLKFGDIVMCEGGEPGRCAIWKEQMPRMVVQKALHRIRCREPMPHEFLYYTLHHLGQIGYLATLFTGATIKHLPREKLALVTVIVPPTRILDLFTSYVRPIEKQLGVLAATNRRATAARDLLLPRLMSGEVAV